MTSLERFKVCAVIVTYNRRKLLEKSLESLRVQSHRPDSIIVINNASTDDTKQYLSIQDDVIDVNMEDNLGGAGGFHYGIAKAVEEGCDFVWLMDDDASADKTALEELTKSYIKMKEYYKEVGFICSKVYGKGNVTLNVPQISSKLDVSGYPLWMKYFDKGVIEVDSCTFVSMLIPIEHIKKLGLPIKEMFIWGDDTEYSLRISNNYHCFISANSKVLHERITNGTLSIVSEVDNNRLHWYEYQYRNKYYNVYRYKGRRGIFWHFVHLFKVILVIIFKSPDRKLLRLKYLMKGTLEGLFFRPKILLPNKKNDSDQRKIIYN